MDIKKKMLVIPNNVVICVIYQPYLKVMPYI